MVKRLALSFALLLVLASLPAQAAVHTDSLILEQLAAAGRADVFVKMDSDVDGAEARAIGDKAARRWRAHDLRVELADRSQAPIREFLRSRGVDFQVFWINNSLFVQGADRALVDALAAFPGVAYLRGNHEVPLHQPVEIRVAPAHPQAIEWNISRINAPTVWATGNHGEGVVVANVDTGVRWTHNALRAKYRGSNGDHNYNWWDPDHTLTQPTDNVGHGTHTMGTMVGDDGAGNQIGVAPGAKWIAAQGCDTNSCSDSDLISSAQWIACPTNVAGNNPDCSKAPDIVNNSWGGGSGDTWYLSYIDAYFDAGIIPVFSAGNNGPNCNTMGSPGDYLRTLSVASTTSSNVLSSFSSRGPSPLSGRHQPDISAPGSSVRSSYNTSDSAYASLSGTSMAAPHVVGTLALVLSDNPGASLKTAIQSVLFAANQAILGSPGFTLSCGGVQWNSYPSNHYGWGLLDAAAAVGVKFPEN